MVAPTAGETPTIAGALNMTTATETPTIVRLTEAARRALGSKRARRRFAMRNKTAGDVSGPSLIHQIRRVRRPALRPL